MKLRLSSFSLQSRMLWLIGCSVILGLALLISYVSWKSSTVVERLSIEKAELEASDIAFDIHFATADAISEVNALARFISIDVHQGRANREIVIEELRACAERSKMALGFWACFEPNAFDGKDHEHLGKPGSNSAGLFSPYWNRAGKDMVLENSENFQKSDYYLIPQKTKGPVMLEPYWDDAGGKKVLMTSYAVPIFKEGHFLGVIGVDYELSFLTGIANQSTYIRDKAGYVTVVSAGKRYAAHPKSERLGKTLFEFDPWAKPFEQQISEGKAFTTNNFSHTLNDTVFRIVSPIIIAEGTHSWTVLVNLPRGNVLAEVSHLRRNILLISGGIVLLVLTVLLLLARAISNPIHNLAVRLREASQHTSEASSHVSTSSQSLAQGASSQAAAIEESSASLEELASMARQNGESSKEATRLANEARDTADQGMAEMEKMKRSMDAIKVSSDEIAKIIKTIDEIAFQTNILALNAAVEAARAGEAGAGFAIVAEEVRALAQRSATAAHETSEKIAGAITNTGHGVQLSTVVAERLQEITSKIRSLDELVARIARASGEEAQGLSQINKAIADMDRVTQSNAASAEESASSAEDLRSQAELMHKAVEELDSIIRGQSRA